MRQQPSDVQFLMKEVKLSLKAENVTDSQNTVGRYNMKRKNKNEKKTKKREAKEGEESLSLKWNPPAVTTEEELPRRMSNWRHCLSHRVSRGSPDMSSVSAL